MKCTIVSALILILAGTSFLFSQEIVINEFQASNASTISDPDFGSYSDWIELYNPSGQAVDLGGWYLTDLRVDTTNWQFPAGITLNPGGYLLVWADGNDIHQTNLHAPSPITALQRASHSSSH